jgi:glycosyltransferase involved in cell wall biosynthesis
LKPILSICIPTLNRSLLLEILLENLEREASAYLDRIEIVVADNASVDETEDVVRRSSLPIVYGRQERTVGFARNMLFATAGLASGEFVWVIGDDDFVLRGGVSRVLASIFDAPDVDYHYLNFGWINYKLRARILREENGLPYASLLKRLQINDTEWKRLSCLEDLVFLPGDNPSAIFSGVFCFVTRRCFFVDAVDTLQPSDSLDGSSTLIADCFPHAMLSLPRVAGKPIAYIGEPCLLQGISGWEWGSYAYKNMIFGTHQFFEWLEKTAFSSTAMQHLWRSYYKMAGRLFFRMLHLRDEHKGLEIVLDKAIPDSVRNLLFWNAFMDESLLHHNTDHEARIISEWVSELVSENPSARLGLWGVAGRGARFIQFSPHLHKNIFWAADRDTALHGENLVGTDLTIFHPDTLCNANLDILVICARSEFVAEITKAAMPLLPVGGRIVSVNGVVFVQVGSDKSHALTLD